MEGVETAIPSVTLTGHTASGVEEAVAALSELVGYDVTQPLPPLVPAGEGAEGGAGPPHGFDASVDDSILGAGALRLSPAVGSEPSVWRDWYRGRVRDLHVWLREYKVAERKPRNEFAWYGATITAGSAMSVIQTHHEHWCALLWTLATAAGGGQRGSGGVWAHELWDGQAGLPRGAAQAQQLLEAQCAWFDPSAEVSA
jgi:hypothetical protein